MMALQRSTIHDLLERFSEYTKDPTQFLTHQPGLQEKFRLLVKNCYDNSKSLEDRSEEFTFTLPKLLVNNFDTEQIWQQVELQNTFVCDRLDKDIKTLASNLPSPVISDDSSQCSQLMCSDEAPRNEKKENVLKSVRFSIPDESLDDDSEEDEELEDEELEDEELEDEELEDEELEDEDDKTEDIEDEDLKFKCSDNGSDSGNRNDMDHNETNDEKINLMCHQKNNTPQEFSNDKGTKSSFEERQQRLKERVEKLEKDMLAEKPWQLKGEVTAKNRPEDSLLNQVLEFDIGSRPAPIITEEAALKLEDVIKNRIINKVWDDVERKIKPVDNPREFKKKLVLDQEKSKLSLAQIYEQDYLKQRDTINLENKNKKEEEPKEHKQLRVLMSSLFKKLDALSNYHYTPLPTVPEPQIVTNLPAVTLEEAIPDATSTAMLLAPEEIQGKVKGDFVSKEERTTTDKKRARRKKKIKQKLKHKEIKSKENELKKLNPGIKNNFAKDKVKKDLERLLKDKSVSHFQQDVSGKSSKSSQQFFARLQDTVLVDGNTKKRKQENVNIDPKRVKL